ncbi:hypothetical protein EJB05_12319 [Eragrostis curvula]|uniref:S-acyltransferase n=1 Tax=Eragrostis curvula TaxID=38414 RepID=A0A5J9VRA7_9POAL|nr:hypothetical protein EJB05_12319 [Eragrostis curvula]
MAHAISIDPERHVEGRHHRGHRGSTGTERPTGSSSSSATCNPVRGVAATLDPGHVCGNPGFLMQSCFGHSSSAPPPPLSPPPPPKVYHVWPGKNVFFLDGRVIFGPDPKGLILTAMAVIFSEWVFLAYIVDRASTHPSLISAFSLILAATVIASLLLTATRDPGIIPRNQVSPLEEARTAASTPSRFVVVNGVEMRMRFCRVCKLFRPPRSSHCAVCDNCVDKFDHHSSWISQCIGLTNNEWHKGRNHTSPNPYDEGTMGNIRECLFEKLSPPRVDFRAVAEPNL